MKKRLQLKPKLLSPDEVDFIANGCGPDWVPNWLRKYIPQFTFRRACDMHDLYYWRGGTKKDKKNVDDFFYKQMKETVRKNCRKRSILKTLLLKAAALFYYTLVSKFGKKSFYFGTPRTYDDLLMVMNLNEEERIEHKLRYQKEMNKLKLLKDLDTWYNSKQFRKKPLLSANIILR